MRDVRRLAVLGLATGLVVAVALRRLDVLPEQALYRTVVLTAAVVMGARLARRLQVAVPRRTRRPSPQPPRHLRQLDHWESVVSGSTRSAFQAHSRLRPRLRQLAAEALARRGVDLDDDPRRARALLGGHAWDWVRPDRPPPRDRRVPGPSLDDLSAVVTAVEQVGRRS